VDLFRERHDEETLESRGKAKTFVERDEVDSARAIATPHQGGCKLERVGGPQRMDGEEALGSCTHLLDRLDLETARSQIVEDFASLLETGGA
jgi:hypothetical protein